MNRSINYKILAIILSTLACGECKYGVRAMDFQPAPVSETPKQCISN